MPDNDRRPTSRLENHATRLAESHTISRRIEAAPSLLDQIEAEEPILRDAYEHFLQTSESEEALSYMAEWLLDNFYVVQRASRQIQEDMPEGYYRRLPKLESAPLRGYPRVFAVAREVIRLDEARIDIDRLTRFVHAYQRVNPLTTGELWALPTMLRMGILGLLAHTVARVIDSETTSADDAPLSIPVPEDLEDDAIVANCIRSLRGLAAQDWRAFFETVSRVEEGLRSDPGNVYARMDFDTRDRYRKAVEEIALKTDKTEEDVAWEAVGMALDHFEPETQPVLLHDLPRRAHVGFYLLDRGREQLESRLDYSPSLSQRLRRWILNHPTLAYVGGIGLLTLIGLLGLVGYALSCDHCSPFQIISVVILTILPTTTLAVNLVNWIITHTIPSRVLPKMDFSAGLPDECQTMVVIPALLTSSDEVEFLLQQLELHYLGNADPCLHFALLTDFADAPEKHMPGDEEILDQAKRGIRALNRKHSREGPDPFHLLHRERLWNPAEDHWMGWERKRGKLEEFNRLIGEDGETSFIVKLGDFDILPEIRYVITLDADTTLPREEARRLVATLAHPLNQAEFDSHTGEVTAGYTILQPRTEVKPTSANETWFSRIFSGDVGIDLYTRAVSDVYQDLFGEGIYVGKGIYEVSSFQRSLEGRVPENALLSHDLFEGIHGRAGLVTDITLYESYPPTYLTYARRLHRWVRGDWQILPWLFPRVPHQGKGKIPSALSLIDRWKILDNLRRSLQVPAWLAFVVAGWLWLPGSPLVWTLVALMASAISTLTGVVTGLIQRLRDATLKTHLPSLRLEIARWALSLVFIPYESLLMVDAIATTLVRVFITRKRLLQWTTTAHTISLFGYETKVGLLWRKMGGAPLLTLAIGVLVGLIAPGALPVAMPLLVAWFLSPQIALWISEPIKHERKQLSDTHRQRLRLLARRTWLYFERSVGPNDHWLPPDHYQEEPLGLFAHRTSPTNIGLLLLSTLSAYDLGYIGPMNLTLRLRSTFESLERLERYRGHFLNWYNTHTLDPLPPRYVSTVDSGNLVACLLALRQGLDSMPSNRVLCWMRWRGLLDTLGVLTEIVEAIEPKELQSQIAALNTQIDRTCHKIRQAKSERERWAHLLTELISEDRQALDRRLIELVESGEGILARTTLHSLHIWLERVHQILDHMQDEQNLLLPWLIPLDEPPAILAQAEADSTIGQTWRALKKALPATPRLKEIAPACKEGQKLADQLQELLNEDQEVTEQVEEARDWCKRLSKQLSSARMAVQSLSIGLRDLSTQTEAFFEDMNFGFLIDPQRQVFHLGYDVDAERLGSNHYDLLASEARTASILAIARGDVPQSHWLHLSRPFTRVNGRQLLLSWNGSMFEYLMPNMLTRSYEGTLLDQTIHGAVQRQIEYGRQKGVPWGVSESGYYRFDANRNYQYRGFGVPGLGRKRGLGDDLVIAPYASLLALPVRPRAVMRNIDRLTREEMLGLYGFYEAIDYTRSRLPLGQERAIVRSYMAHHQGMIMVSLTNYLEDESMVHRFHADPRIQSVELLLQEQVPREVPVEETPEETAGVTRPPEPRIELEPWNASTDAPLPQVHALSNGRYGVIITSAGAGYSYYTETQARDGVQIALTRWRPDTTLDNWGTWIYVQDHDIDEIWSAGIQPTGAHPQYRGARFYAHRAEFRRRDHDISLHYEIGVTPGDDVEMRRVTLTNRSDRTRHLSITSYGEVVLAPQRVDARHPAFNKLFIESEYVPEANALLFRRRPRSAEEEPIYLAHAVLPLKEGSSVKYETDRGRFLGRGRTPRSPAALASDGGGLSGTVGATLDPIMALQQDIELAPHTEARIAYLTVMADSREKALTSVRRYQSWGRMERAFDGARSQSERELRRLGLDVHSIQNFQELLSALLYPHPGLRATSDTIAANRKGQSALWPYAISGDYPILLVQVRDVEETDLVRELLKAHTYWRKRNIEIDLVVLNLQDAGYAQELQDKLHRLITQTDNDAWLNRRGGIFLLRAAQMDQATEVLLRTAARAVLDGGEGSLADQLRSLHRRPTRLPEFVPTIATPEEMEPAPPLERPTDLQFDNEVGGFSEDGREYVIYLDRGRASSEKRCPPAPWVNVIAYPNFGFMVSESGSGYTWAENSGENRLTAWRNDPVTDMPSEALYLRDEVTAHIWSPTPLPAGEEGPYLIRHGAGYTTFEHHSHGLKQRVRFFATPDAPVKVMQLRLENTRQTSRRITALLYAEWVLGTRRDVTQQYIVPEFDTGSSTLLARNPYSQDFGERVAFVTASEDPHGLTADRTEFLGRNGSLRHPAALDRVGLVSHVEAGGDPCAAFQIHLDISAGETKEVFFLLGQGENRQRAIELAETFQDQERVDQAWEAVHEFWDNVLGTVTVDTPDEAMDLLLNRWLLYQALSCRVWGRSALYQSSGAFGYRDQLQDVMSLIHAVPDVARDHILRAAGHQFEAGDVLHWWHPPEARGVRTRISDDLLWLPFVTAHYFESTGDEDLLTEEVPFRAAEPLEADEEERYGRYETTSETSPVYEHCRRALEKGSTAGEHGLPLIGSGDWNDGMNRVGIEGQGESVWLGWFLYATLTRFAPLCERLGDDEQAAAYRSQAKELQQALHDHAWDGDWYLRAYYDDGSPLGSAENREAKITSLAQSWAVLSKAGQTDRVKQAMRAVEQRLVRPNDKLLLLFTPPFDETPRDPGYIKGYPPGIRENGGQYTHAALWAVWAFAELGQGNQAGALFRLLNPIYHSDTLEKAQRYHVEPYVVAADVYSADQHLGRGGWTWYTGSSGWMYRLGTEAILGLRRKGQALRLEPCIPEDWPGYEITYRYGKSEYRIQVDNPDGVQQGVRRVTLDGEELPGEEIPLEDDGQEHQVHVTLGKSD